MMGLNCGYRDISAQQRIGGYFADLESLEDYIRFLSFDCYVSDDCNQGRARWFCCPVNVIDGVEARR